MFKIHADGTSYTVLYTFAGTPGDGSIPWPVFRPLGNLVALSPGNLYGTTNTGGTNDAGTVYQLTTTGCVP